jgi:hypothetical protein
MGWRAMPKTNGSRSGMIERTRSPPIIVAVLSICTMLPAITVAADDDAMALSPPAAPSHPPARVATAGPLDHRVAVLTKALELDARQQAELARIFASQREAVKKIWSNPALLAAERVPATRAAEDRTGDAIREILTDEQKKKYNPPKPPAPPPSRPPDIGAWMDATRAK